MAENLEARIGRLEKSARRWKVAAVGLGVAMMAGVMMGQIRMGGAGGISAPALTADKVTRKKILLTDGDGNERASFSLDATNTAELALKDKNGMNLLTLRADSDGGAGVKVLTNKGKTLMAAGADGKDQPSILLQDVEGKKVWGAP